MLNILLFLQYNTTSPFEEMFMVHHFGPLGLNKYDHVIHVAHENKTEYKRWTLYPKD